MTSHREQLPAYPRKQLGKLVGWFTGLLNVIPPEGQQIPATISGFVELAADRFRCTIDERSPSLKTRRR
jgi:hypothetical protein